MKIIKGILSTAIVFLLSLCMIAQLCVSAVTKNYADSELKDELYTEIQIAEESNAPGDNYTNQSVSVLYEAIKKAQEVYYDQNATDADIENAIDFLKSAVKGLTKPDVDTKELWELIEKSESIQANKDKYTQTSYEEFCVAYSDACAAYYYGQTQEQIDRAKAALASVMANLETAEDLNRDIVVAPDVLNLKNKLLFEIQSAEKSYSPGDNYTIESVTVLQEAIKKAEEIYNDQNTTEADIEKAIDSLKSAVEGLTQPNIDTKELWKVIEESKYYTTRENKFTKTSYDKFRAAYADAYSAYNYAQTQEQVDIAKDGLVAAMKNMEKISCIVGDVNEDNVISVLDATLIQKYLSNYVDFNDVQEISADFNDDGIVNIEDSTCIQKELVNII